MFKIKKGLNLPIEGAPVQEIDTSPQGRKHTRQVGVVGFDYHGMKPTMEVAVGDRVKCGQLLFTDKKTPGVRYTAPASGVVSAINRGDKRVFQSLVIDVDGDEHESFPSWTVEQLATVSREEMTQLLIDSGEWTALRTRPYSKVPAIDSEPHSIFVTAIDTHPLAADPAVVIETDRQAFFNGLLVLGKLTRGKVFVCTNPEFSPELPGDEQFRHGIFAGPHPAGLAGTHIHHLDPVSESKMVWSINYQDVMAFGRLVVSGQRSVERIISLAGPAAREPRLVTTRLGASLDELVEGELNTQEKVRVISGSVLGGRKARRSVAFLGRYANQVSLLEEGDKREFMGWLSPGANRFSVLNIYLSSLSPGKLFKFNTTTNGSERAMVPVGAYEKVMPLDILPTQLLRSLIVEDTEVAQKLGCLELDEEDLSLCTFVCPGKYEYGPILRRNLTRIEIEG